MPPSLVVLIGWLFSNASWVILAALFFRLWAWLMDRRFTWRKEIAFWVFVPPFLFFVFSKFGLINRPQLTVRIDRIHITKVPLDSAFPPGSISVLKDELGIIVVGNVRNAGMQSMADCCTLTITPNGVSQPLPTDRIQFPAAINVRNPDNTVTIATYEGKDALYDKLGGKTIQTGEMVRGVLLFGVAGLSYETLTSPGTKYELSMTDVTGAPAVGTYVWSVTENPINGGYTPGLSGGGCPVPAATPIPFSLPTAPQNGNAN